MSTDTLKHELIEHLTRLPSMQDYNTRTNLLENVTGAGLIYRVTGNARDDLLRIFDFAMLPGLTVEGIPALEIVRRNARRYLPADTQLAATIERLFDGLLPPKEEAKKRSGDEMPFVNRQDELNNILSDMAPPYHVIEAPAGYGKTKIMEALQVRFREKEKNYLCGSASGLNKQSFVNIISELGKNLGLPNTPLPAISELPNDEEALLALARDLGDRHASLILGQYFSDDRSPEAFAGVVILIDDLDRIIKEGISHSQLVGQVKREIKMLVDGYVRALQEGLALRTPFRGQNRFRVVISLRYGSEYSYLPFHEMPLRPFEYIYVSETVARVLTQYDRESLDQISAHLLHLTGGHPDCIIDLLKSYNANPVKPERFEKPEYAKSIWETVVKPKVRDIKDSIPEDLRPIFLALSFYRVFNTAILDRLIQDGYLITSCDRHELADRLTLTYLYQRRGHLLSDAITRRLFAIEQRNTMSAEEFRKCCEQAYQLSLVQLDNVQRQNVDEWALECFYQFLQSGSGNVQDPAQRAAMEKKFREEIIPQIMTAYSKNSIDFEADRSLLVQKIRKDWELLFTVNYCLREKDFNNEPVQAFLALIEKWQPPVS